MMTALNNNSGDVNMEGLDQLQDLIKRLSKLEQTTSNFVTKDEKVVIDKEIKELNKVIT